jgi:hypothetical protein
LEVVGLGGCGRLNEQPRGALPLVAQANKI